MPYANEPIPRQVKKLNVLVPFFETPASRSLLPFNFILPLLSSHTTILSDVFWKIHLKKAGKTLPWSPVSATLVRCSLLRLSTAPKLILIHSLIFCFSLLSFRDNLKTCPTIAEAFQPNTWSNQEIDCLPTTCAQSGKERGRIFIIWV